MNRRFLGFYLLSLLSFTLTNLVQARVPVPHPDFGQDIRIARKGFPEFIFNPQNPGKGAVSGAIGALTAETLAEALPEDLSRQTRGDVGKVAGAAVGLLSGQDVSTAITTASNAIENNFLPGLVAAVVIIDKVANVVMTAKEFSDTYHEEGLDAAIKELAIKGGTRLAFGSGGKFLLKLKSAVPKTSVKTLFQQAKQGKLPATTVGKEKTLADGISTIKLPKKNQQFSHEGRTGRQARLKELANDPKLGNSDRGWIQQEMNEVARGKKRHLRVPPGKELAHKRGFEASKGYSYEHSNLQNKDLHKLQHKYDMSKIKSEVSKAAK